MKTISIGELLALCVAEARRRIALRRQANKVKYWQDQRKYEEQEQARSAERMRRIDRELAITSNDLGLLQLKK